MESHVRSRTPTFLTVLGLALLAGCATPAKKEGKRDGDILTAETILEPAPPLKNDEVVSGISVGPDVKSNRPPPKPEIDLGTGKFVNPQPAAKVPSGEGQVTFNFENQPVQAVVKAILGDMLQENYTIAPNVGGNVTYSTSRPIRREDALPVLEMLLSWTGNALVREGGRYTVMQSKDAIPGKLTPRLGASQQPGYGLRIFPLKYISASETAKLLKPYAKADAFVQIDPNRSLLVLAGTPSELDNYQRTIDTFDVDWMRGMSIGVFTLQHVEVAKMIPDLQKLFGTEGESPLAGMFRFMPIESTNSIVAITPQPEYLKQAEEWLYRLDRGGAENSVQLYIYNVKNLKAVDIADYLSEIFLGTSGGGSRRSSTSGRVGQGLKPITMGGLGGSGGSMNYQNSLRPQSAQEKTAPASTPATSSSTTAGSGGSKKETDIRISAIEENNQLMIMATPYEWESIQSAIRKLDVVPLQVQIEAKILEVSLTGGLSYGVQWYLAGLIGSAQGSVGNGTEYGTRPDGTRFGGKPQDRHRSSLGATGNAGPPNNSGFFYSFLNRNFEVAISALETSGQAKTLSAPSLVVLNNQEAQINVGSQLPVTQTSVSGLGTTATYNSVQYLNTGVQLSVTPRVNPGGLVYIDVQQEVSNPPAGYSSTSGTNPAIEQRQLQTQIAVQSGQTVMLGGLIRDINNTTDKHVPFLGRIPVVGNLFGNTSTDKQRTELIVLITPRVITNSDEARQITEDYSRKFESLAPLRVKRESSQSTQSQSPEPTRTYPVPESAKPQEDMPQSR
jgi:general secretion pathway protein D